jgi:phosphatidylserine/phosphatidylglycerophosphate/cardiolipin synthase-like enzyme
MTADCLVLAPADRRERVIEIVRSARERLILSLFRCNDYPVMDELGAAAARGVHVEVLITQRAKGGKKRLRRLGQQFEAMGATVWHYDDPLVKYHAKYIVSDDRTALVGSFNLTRRCFKKTADFGVITSDPAVVGGLIEVFHSDCRHTPVPETITPRIVLAPEAARLHVTELIESAAQHIRLIDPNVDDPVLVGLLSDKQQAGVRVDLVTGKRVGRLRLHGKLLIVDNRVALISSMSLSPPSLNYRREVAIELNEPSHVQELVDYFHALAGPDPLPLPPQPRGEDAVL